MAYWSTVLLPSAHLKDGAGLTEGNNSLGFFHKQKKNRSEEQTHFQLIKKNRNYQLVTFAVPAKHGVKGKESEELNKHQNLAQEEKILEHECGNNHRQSS